MFYILKESQILWLKRVQRQKINRRGLENILCLKWTNWERDKSNIKSKLKIADIDPRKEEVKNSFTISDKARTIAGGVLEAILYMKQKHEDR